MRYSSGIGIPFGKYQLLRKLAAGGMAEIFLAETGTGATASSRLVIKRILPHLTDDANFLEMFLDEARIAARLRHPGIIQILDLGRIEDSLFIAMEYVRGEDLANVLKAASARGRPMPPAMVATILAKVADALDYAHGERDLEGRPMHIVHRDVTPQNIMVGFDGSVKLLDFGIAKVQGQLSRTKPGTVKGKYFYMSPEQCRGKELDGRSDLFSIGILLYEMTTGMRPFAQESEFDTLKMIVNSEPMPPSVHVAGYPEPLARIIERALSKDRDARYPSGGALREALEGYLADTGQLGAVIASYVKDLFPERALRDPEDSGIMLVDSASLAEAPSESQPQAQMRPTSAPLLPFDSDSDSSSSATVALALGPGTLQLTQMMPSSDELVDEPSISIVSDPHEFSDRGVFSDQETVADPNDFSQMSSSVTVSLGARLDMSRTLPSEGSGAIPVVTSSGIPAREVSALTRREYHDSYDEDEEERKKAASWFTNLIGVVAIGLVLGSALAFALRPSARPPATAEEREPPAAVASSSTLKKTRISEERGASKRESTPKVDSKKDRDPKPKPAKKVAKKSKKPDKR